MRNKLLLAAEQSGLRTDLTKFEVGDTINVHQRILEGQKELVGKDPVPEGRTRRPGGGRKSLEKKDLA